MPIDTFFAFFSTYDDVEDAKADYDAVKALHVEADAEAIEQDASEA